MVAGDWAVSRSTNGTPPPTVSLTSDPTRTRYGVGLLAARDRSREDGTEVLPATRSRFPGRRARKVAGSALSISSGERGVHGGDDATGPGERRRVDEVEQDEPAVGEHPGVGRGAFGGDQLPRDPPVGEGIDHDEVDRGVPDRRESRPPVDGPDLDPAPSGQGQLTTYQLGELRPGSRTTCADRGRVAATYRGSVRAPPPMCSTRAGSPGLPHSSSTSPIRRT